MTEVVAIPKETLDIVAVCLFTALVVAVLTALVCLSDEESEPPYPR